MNVQVLINGTDRSTYLISYTRNQNICSGIGVANFIFSSTLPRDFTIYSTIVLYEEGVKKATYYITTVSDMIDKGYTVIVDAQDGTKRLQDWFIEETLYVEDNEYYAKDRIEYYLNKAGVDYVFDTEEGNSVLDSDSTWGPASCMELVIQLMQQCGWYLYFDANNVCHISHINSGYTDTTIYTTDMLEFTENKDDTMVRNKAVVYGKYLGEEGYITAEKETTTEYDIDENDKRATVIANHNIGTESQAVRVCDMLLSEFGRAASTKGIVLAGAPDLNIGDVILLDSEYATGQSLITDMKTSMTDRGLSTAYRLDERCPRLFAFYDGAINGVANPLLSGWILSGVGYTPRIYANNWDPCVYASTILRPDGLGGYIPLPENIPMPTIENKMPLPAVYGKKLVFGFVDVVDRDIACPPEAYGDPTTGGLYCLKMTEAIRKADYVNVPCPQFNSDYYGIYPNFDYHYDIYGAEGHDAFWLLPTPVATTGILGLNLVLEYRYLGQTLTNYLPLDPTVAFSSLDCETTDVYVNNLEYTGTINNGAKVRTVYTNFYSDDLPNLVASIENKEAQWGMSLNRTLPFYTYRQVPVKIDRVSAWQPYNMYQYWNWGGRGFNWFGAGVDHPDGTSDFGWFMDGGNRNPPPKWTNINGAEVWEMKQRFWDVNGTYKKLGDFCSFYGRTKYNFTTIYDSITTPGYNMYVADLGRTGHHNGRILLQYDKYGMFPSYIIDDGYYSYKSIGAPTNPFSLPKDTLYGDNNAFRIYSATFRYFEDPDIMVNSSLQESSYTLLQMYWEDPVRKIRYRVNI